MRKGDRFWGQARTEIWQWGGKISWRSTWTADRVPKGQMIWLSSVGSWSCSERLLLRGCMSAAVLLWRQVFLETATAPTVRAGVSFLLLPFAGAKCRSLLCFDPPSWYYIIFFIFRRRNQELHLRGVVSLRSIPTCRSRPIPRYNALLCISGLLPQLQSTSRKENIFPPDWFPGTTNHAENIADRMLASCQPLSLCPALGDVDAGWAGCYTELKR